MTLVSIGYWAAVAGLLLYGLNALVLTAAFLLTRRRGLARLREIREEAARAPSAAPPVVTVQIPLYNERFVAARVIDAVAALEYPRERLEIQVLDDSTDDTSEIVAAAVARHRARGLDVCHVRRAHRDGFKAGALRDGLARARGELVAIFDADFVPRADFLARCVPFFAAPDVGLVQARWGHLNAEQSTLTRLQAIAIDGHFGVEQAARCWSGWMLNFNGTAGLWRRAAIEDAGGWQADTLTEDLDLSYRAQLAGWRAEYLIDTEVPAELPVSLAALRSQQRRWARGSIETAIKLAPRVLASRRSPLVKAQALLHLTHYAVHPLMLAVALLALPMLVGVGAGPPLPFEAAAALLLLGTAGPSTLYVVARRTLRPGDAIPWRRLPALMVLGTGLAVSNTRAILGALVRRPPSFVRTPKLEHVGVGPTPVPAATPSASAVDADVDVSSASASPTDDDAAAGGYGFALDPGVLLELLLAAYAAVSLVTYLARVRWLIGPFLLLYTIGFATVGLSSLRETRGSRAPNRRVPRRPPRLPTASFGRPDPDRP